MIPAEEAAAQPWLRPARAAPLSLGLGLSHWQPPGSVARRGPGGAAISVVIVTRVTVPVPVPLTEWRATAVGLSLEGLGPPAAGTWTSR